MSSLTSYLAKKGAVDASALQQVLLNQAINGGGIGLNLLEVGAVDEDTLVQLTGSFHHLPFLSTSDCLKVEPDTARVLPIRMCLDLDVIPVRDDDDVLVVGCIEPKTRSDKIAVERVAAKRVKFAVVSPLTIPFLVSLHHDRDLDPRIRRILASLGFERLGLEGLPEPIREKIEKLIENDESSSPDSDDDDEISEDWDDWDDLEDIEEEPEAEPEDLAPRDSIVGKYIIINRIGTRPRRPSIQMRKVEPDVEPPESPDGSEDQVEDEVTFTDGSVKASDDTRPHRPSWEPEEARKSSSPPPRRSSVPPSVLKEVVEEYLAGDLSPPPRIDEAIATPPPPEEASEKPSDSMNVGKTISVGPPPSDDTTSVEKHPDDAIEQLRRSMRKDSKTLPGVAVPLEALEAARSAPAQGYAVDVPPLVSLPEILEEIEGAGKASEVIDAVHRYALQFFDFVLVMRYRRGRFEVSAMSSRGWVWPVDGLPNKHMGYDQLPDTISKLSQPHLGGVDDDSAIASFLDAIGRPVPPNAIMMPITLKGRAIVVIYGDNGAQPVAFEDAHDLFHATWVATNTLLALLEQQR